MLCDSFTTQRSLLTNLSSKQFEFFKPLPSLINDL